MRLRLSLRAGEDRRAQAFQVVATIVSDAIHVERRRALDFAALAALEITLRVAPAPRRADESHDRICVARTREQRNCHHHWCAEWQSRLICDLSATTAG